MSSSSSHLPALQPTDILPPRARAEAAARRLRLAGISPAVLSDAAELSAAEREVAALARGRRTLGFLLCLVVAGLVTTSGTRSLPQSVAFAEAAAPAGTATTAPEQLAGAPTEAQSTEPAAAAPADATDAVAGNPAPSAQPQPVADPRPQIAEGAENGGPATTGSVGTAAADTTASAPRAPRPTPSAERNASLPAPSSKNATTGAATGGGTVAAPRSASPAAAQRTAPTPPKAARVERPAPVRATQARPMEPRVVETRPVQAYVPPPPAEGPTAVDIALFPLTASSALVGGAQASVGAAVEFGRETVMNVARLVR
jgi:hypothetical protein